MADILEIESYVLRYYEEKLELNILRNNQGHRIYTQENIDRFRQIKELREQGFQLKAVKNALDQLEDTGIESLLQITTTLTGTGHGAHKKEEELMKTEQVPVVSELEKESMKAQQLSLMMKDAMKQALLEHNEDTKVQIKEELTEEMQLMVGKRMREIEVAQKNRDEAYYNQLDETMREIQKLKKTMAEIEDTKGTAKPKGFFHKLFGAKEVQQDGAYLEE